MKSNKALFGFIFLFALLASLGTFARDYYQIKIYTIKDKIQESTIDTYLKNAYIPALHRAGIKTVGVFKPIESDQDFGAKIFVFIPINKIEQVEKIEIALLNDKKYNEAGASYINAAFDSAPFERIESVLLRAFEKHPDYFVPNYDTPKSDQVFELRSYQSASEKIGRKKVEMFNDGGECALFEKLEFNPVFYGEVISGADMPNLMYMTSFENMESNREHWKAFVSHPDWKELSGKEEYKNTVSHIDKWLCHPTDYSDI